MTYRVDCQYSDGVKTDWIRLTEAMDHVNGCTRPHNIRQEEKPEEMRRWKLYVKDESTTKTILLASNLSINNTSQLGHFHNIQAGRIVAGLLFYTEEVTNNVLSH